MSTWLTVEGNECHLIVLDLQHSLAEVLALKQTEEALGGVVDALCDMQLGLEAAICDPRLHLLLVLLAVSRPESWVADDEPLHRYPL
ncbi:hypothetical protein FJTKL_14015 [Diaporthe vaccinii]|uniref:Uncharacterized protein n=1 Tax=Diaporthe vaccinii TaxID=105482 RepID=A0ABR4E9D2_9PEZI